MSALALAPDGPPALLVWRGARHRVARADGPERVHGEWWVAPGEEGAVRDYYRAETTDGSRPWVFRDAPASDGGRWWLHGVGEAGQRPRRTPVQPPHCRRVSGAAPRRSGPRARHPIVTPAVHTRPGGTA